MHRANFIQAHIIDGGAADRQRINKEYHTVIVAFYILITEDCVRTLQASGTPLIDPGEAGCTILVGYFTGDRFFHGTHPAWNSGYERT